MYIGTDELNLDIRVPNNFYLSSTERKEIDHSYFLNNQSNIIKKVQEADILLLGNSRMMFGINEKLISEHNNNSRYKIYNFAFDFGEGIEFPKYLIEKYQITPKAIIVHAGPYTFNRFVTDKACESISRSRWFGYRESIELRSNTYLQNWIHKIIPKIRIWEQHSMRRYRSLMNGCLRYETTLLGEIEFQQMNGDFNIKDEYLMGLNNFYTYCKEHGISLILTQVPAPDLNANFLSNLANQTNIPSISIAIKNPSTFDNSHLDKQSALKFTEQILHKLKSLNI
jgi:hypothetical protein